MMFKSKYFYLVLVFLIGAAAVYYKTSRMRKANNEVAYLMQTVAAPTTTPNSPTTNTNTAPKLFGSLLITNGIPNSQNMANGVLCLENANNLDKVDLFMPDMGHGSEPPKVTPTDAPKELLNYQKTVPHFGCYLVESMQLFMPGVWQVRAFYKDGTSGIFTLDLKK
ncbi:MAG: hypothetical protein V4591_06910 [Bdellovibrionota bacterium]